MVIWNDFKLFDGGSSDDRYFDFFAYQSPQESSCDLLVMMEAWG